MSGNNGSSEKIVLFFRTEWNDLNANSSSISANLTFFKIIVSSLNWGRLSVNGTDLSQWWTRFSVSSEI